MSLCWRRHFVVSLKWLQLCGIRKCKPRPLPAQGLSKNTAVSHNIRTTCLIVCNSWHNTVSNPKGSVSVVSGDQTIASHKCTIILEPAEFWGPVDALGILVCSAIPEHFLCCVRILLREAHAAFFGVVPSTWIPELFPQSRTQWVLFLCDSVMLWLIGV